MLLLGRARIYKFKVSPFSIKCIFCDFVIMPLPWYNHGKQKIAQLLSKHRGAKCYNIVTFYLKNKQAIPS